LAATRAIDALAIATLGRYSPRRKGHFAKCASHAEFSGDHVTQRVAHVTPRGIRFIDLSQVIAVNITFPMHSFKVLYQLLAAWIDLKPAFTRLVFKASRSHLTLSFSGGMF
jgi:hypothetical protein